MKRFLLTALTVTTLVAKAELKLHDGFEAGGTAPGAGQYVSEPTSTTGSNKDSLVEQAPVLAGFAEVNPWAASYAVTASTYPRVEEAGLSYTDAGGRTLVTRTGAVNIQSSVSAGTQQARRYTTLTGAMPAAGTFTSALMQFAPNSAGMVRYRQGDGATYARDLYVGFNTAGKLVVGWFQNSSAGNYAEYTGTTTFAADLPHLVVAKWYETNKATVWVDPPNLSDLTSAPAEFSAVTISYVGDNADYPMNMVKLHTTATVDSSFVVDELRVATTWPEVLPHIAPGAPGISTGAATPVGIFGATLNGHLSTTGAAPTTVWAVWSTNTALSALSPLADWENRTVVTPDPMVAEDIPVAALATGLLPDRTYRFTFFASNQVALAAAPGVGTFTTQKAIPAIQVGLATNVTPTTGFLNGTLTWTGAAPTTVWAVWDTGDHPAATTPQEWPHSADLGVLPIGPVSFQATGLEDAALHVFRFYATNDYGAVWSDFAVAYPQTSCTVYDGFAASATPNVTEYRSGSWPDDNLVGQAPITDGFGAASPWTSSDQFSDQVYFRALPTGLEYPGLQTTAGGVRIFRNAAGIGKATKRLSNAATAHPTNWVAFLVKRSVTNVWFTVTVGGGTDAPPKTGIDNVGRPFFEGGGTNGSARAYGNAVGNDVAHLFLLRFAERPEDFYADVDLWVDPALDAGEAGLGTPTIGGKQSLFSEYPVVSEPNQNLDVPHPFGSLSIAVTDFASAGSYEFDEFQVAADFTRLLHAVAPTVIILQ